MGIDHIRWAASAAKLFNREYSRFVLERRIKKGILISIE
jgi:hypothetical protein